MEKILIQDIVRKKTPDKKVVSADNNSEIAQKIEKVFKEKTNTFNSGFKTIIPKIHWFSRLNSKLILGCIVFAALLAICAVALFKFSSIAVEITPHQKNIDIDTIFQASTNPRSGELPLEVMQISHEENGMAVPTLTKKVSQKSSGKVIIYNNYSSQPQLLIRDTRFETPEGKIYRIDKNITLPGAKIEGGKITPSETEAIVYADKPGEEYNNELTDFTVPGFKDPVKREKIYGRSKTKMEGGFVGEATVIAEEDINNLASSLENKVNEYLEKMTVNPKPENFILYDSAKKIIFEQNKNGPEAGEMAIQFELKKKATLFGFLLKKEDISRMLAEKYFNKNEALNFKLINAENLSFELKEFSADNIKFSLKGPAFFIRKIDEESIKKDLVGGEKNPFPKYDAINRAKIIFKPKWWHVLPKNQSKIDIIINAEGQY